MLKGNSPSVAPAPASPLPSIDDVQEALFVALDESDNREGFDAMYVADAIQALYREHFAAWLESDDAAHTLVCYFAGAYHTRDEHKQCERALSEIAKAVRESGDL